MQKDETHNLPEKVQGWLKVFNPNAPRGSGHFLGVIMLALSGTGGSQQVHLY